MNDTRIEMALNAMQTEAQLLRVKGVATVVIQPVGDRQNFTIHQRAIGRYFRSPQPEERGPGDMGTSYLIGSYAKAAETLRTGWGSGESEQPLLRCEFGWRGSVIAFSGDHHIIGAFSGGTPEEDLLIAEAGKRALIE